MELFWLLVHAHPEEWHPEFDLKRGAYISCWIRAASPKDAQNVAYAQLRKAHWSIEAIERPPRTVSEQSSKAARPWLKARICDEMFVIHGYTTEEDRANFLAAIGSRSHEH